MSTKNVYVLESFVSEQGAIVKIAYNNVWYQYELNKSDLSDLIFDLQKVNEKIYNLNKYNQEKFEQSLLDESIEDNEEEDEEDESYVKTIKKRFRGKRKK